ncbi:DUF4365 domain-containing protein [Exiguobacterium profundum]|uniref:DUF4365 domain-containing protein n=1 Tax=Exiguobacterium TaxID=33986 RepID=UPI0012F3593A|nr:MULTISPECIES: DUF4365 domain-containing protein [Exiguobacterium]MDX5981234.1 DUF4365 domain-containing protein [Exiguobacterium profundum]VXC02623.1 conserved hypothetical protein [Exiguobacterium sp. 8H]VXC23836.1 conserved hypothetical protein [Exiguobacterium sp. 8A]
MPNFNWEHLNHLQLGRYAEYYAKMEFASYGCDVYTSEVDDHGVDFVIKDSNNRFCEIQVKAIRNSGYVFMQKSKFDLTNPNLYLTLLLFTQDAHPELYLIPNVAWLAPNELFVDRDYDKPGQKSKPEYGLNISRKNKSLLEHYRFDTMIQSFILRQSEGTN